MFVWIAVIAIIVLVLPLTFVAYRLSIPSYMTGYKMLFSHSLLLIGLLLILWSVNTLNYSRVEEKWPVTKGNIVSADIVGKRAPHPAVKYTYHVGDSLYSGLSDMDAPGFGTKAARLQTAQAIIRALKPGMQINVHYNPDNPQKSVLQAHPKWNVFMQYGLGILFMSLALAFILAAVFQRRSLKKQLDV